MQKCSVPKEHIQFGSKKQADIVELESTDPKMFWKEIGKIGIRQDMRKEIPMEVKLSVGNLNNNVNDVLKVRKTGFENLRNGRDDEDISVLQHDNPYFDNNTGLLNSDICETELKIAIKRLKCNKATDIDELPVEVLKCERLTHILLRLFNKYFTLGLIPDVWKKGVVNPIPKSSARFAETPLITEGSP